ncbi:ATP binding protein [Aureococcus anophagefferens]|nr:ATP binding protein [Aureococcus anophagefferens]
MPSLDDECKGGESKGGESKGGESKGGDDDDVDVIDVTDVMISPNDCDFDEPLRLEIEFGTRRELRGAHWKVGYLVDTVAATRHVVELGRTAPADYAGSDCFFEFAADRIPVDGIAPSELANCGLLTAAHRPLRVARLRRAARGVRRADDGAVRPERHGARSTPCVIALSATGEYVIGEAAETQMAKNADATVPSVLATLPRAADGAALAEAAAARCAAAGCSVAVSDVAGDVEIVLTPPPNEDEDEPPAKPGKLRARAAPLKVLAASSRSSTTSSASRNEALCCVVAVPSTILGDAVAMASLKRAAKAAKLSACRGSEARPSRRGRGQDPKLDGVDGVAVLEVGGRGAACAAFLREPSSGVLSPVVAEAARRLGGHAMAEALGHCVTFLKRRQKIDVAEGGKKAQRKLRVACVRAAKVLGAGAAEATVEAGRSSAARTRPLISEAATKVAKGAKYASARADFCLATAALPGSPVPATHAASLELAGDGAAAFVVAFDGDAPLAVLDCSKFAGASKVELAATLDEKANLKLVATVDGDENPVSLDVPASA